MLDYRAMRRDLLGWAWIGAARLRRRSGRHVTAPREALVREHAAGRSFVDVGCMWSVDGAFCFAAEDAGASSVTGIDLMPASPSYMAEHARRDSRVRFLQGDVHDQAVVVEAGPHDVVWCSGVLYHAPHPLLTLERLRALCGERLLLATATIPELPGVAQGCVLYPGLHARDRAVYGPVLAGHRRIGVSEPFDRAESYGNWWWGISSSALRGMLAATGFKLLEEWVEPFAMTVVAEPV